jgi:hypothetical protein
VRVLEAGEALEPGDLVLLEQELDPAGELLDRVEPLAVHRLEVELGGDLDAHLRHRAVGGGVEILRRVSIALEGMQPTLRQVRRASRGSRRRRFQPELRGADRRDVAAGPAPMTSTS